MNTIEFDIKKSQKSCIEAKEQFIVVRNHRVYLRAVGEEDAYVVMTATASEDDGRILAYPNQAYLIENFVNLVKNLEGECLMKTDFHGRDYAETGIFQYISDVHRFSEMLLKNMEDSANLESEASLTDVGSCMTVEL